MTRHIIRRFIQAIPTLFGVTLISYLIMTAAPGGPARLLTMGLSDQNEAGEIRRQIEERWGLNDPWIIQYLTWLVGNDWMSWKDTPLIDDSGQQVLDENGAVMIRERFQSYGILRGDFGFSIADRTSAVSDLIGQKLPATFELGVASLVVALMLGIPIGIFAAIWRGSLFDNATRILAVVGNAIPGFWFGLILLSIFAFGLGWLPNGNRCNKQVYTRISCGEVPLYNRLDHLVLPTIVLAYGGVAGFSRFMRTSMLDTINSDFIRTARAKGLRNRTVWFRHAARNSLIPIATFMGPALVGTINGAAITEQIFNWPGLGRLFVGAISARDYPVVMAAVFIGSVLTILGYILSDIFYAWVDPRIRFS